MGSLSFLQDVFLTQESGSPALQMDSLPTELWCVKLVTFQYNKDENSTRVLSSRKCNQQLCLDNDWVESRFPPNTLHSHVDYLELNILKKQQVQEGHSDLCQFTWKQKIILPCEGCPPCIRKRKDLLSPEREFRVEKVVEISLVTSLIYYSNPKLSCFIKSS